jgi:hypothetical protein
MFGLESKSDKLHKKNWFVLLLSLKSLPSHDNTVSVTKINTDQPTVRICKGKAILYRPITGPEGSWRLRIPDFATVSTRKW